MCGEHDRAAHIGSLFAGSSPRVRGTRDGRPVRPALQRFIPACAGNTSPASSTSTATTVHPRVCGEHASRHRPLRLSPGSSPRVRGTRLPWDAIRRCERFIPACAGNTRASRGRRRAACGSSPRVRGTRLVVRPELNQRRFIPACAGNTRCASLSTRDRPVHPRVCGEHRPQELVRDRRGRFIPACAGNTSC